MASSAMNGWAVAGTSFIASAVEMVEALTIVLAVGLTHGYRRSLSAAAAALALLAVIVAAARPLLLWLEPLPAFRIAVGAYALWFGWGWLKKAVLRAAGRKAQRDEAAAFARTTSELTAADLRAAFGTAFNGVFLEGVEVVIIVLAFGATALGAMSWAVGGALAALAVVAVVGFALHRPLAAVPENAMKFVVGVMLTAFGIYWIGEGAGVSWWYADAALGYLALAVLAAALFAARAMRSSAAR